jgi:hypothetical protein
MKSKKELKVTFKKHPKPTGLAGVGWGWYTDGKVQGKICAHMSGGGARSKGVRIQVAVTQEPTQNDPAPFRWIMVENDCKTEADARIVVQKAVNNIAQEHELYFFEN